MPRLTDSAFRDLAIWMIGLGLCTGLIFPPFAVLLGLPAAEVITPLFVGASVGAGLMVGGLNYTLARGIVGTRVRLLAGRMELVREGIETATWSGDWSGCTPERCTLIVDSKDEFGESAGAFNSLVMALAESHGVETAIRGFSATLANHAELAQVSRHALAELIAVSSAGAGVILVDTDGTLAVAAASGLAAPDELVTNPVIAETMRIGTVRRLDAPAGFAVDAILTAYPAQSVVVLPLMFRAVSVGVAVLAATGRISDAAERLLDVLRPQLAVAVNNALAHERIQQLATLDPLTGLFNRRFGLARLREEYTRSVRSELPLTVAMLDIDYFKAVNDTYGHAVGDRVLVAVGRAARRAVREGDVLIRYGGEELLMLLVGASLEDGATISDRIRRAVAETVVQDGERSIRVTASMGIAAIPDAEVRDEDDLVKRADGAMYRAKAAGRDRLVLA